ncbi:MAG TPA: sugar ABC transporter permease [Propionibacteriaceae bacterium]|nr:sugar ABC transporter permease [Propionibacteriaceae bacterium]
MSTSVADPSARSWHQPPEGQRKRSRLSKNKTREALAGYLFVAPGLLHFLVFTVYLLAMALVMSTWVWDLLTPHQFRGLYNYKTLLFEDKVFRTAFKNTLIYAAMTIVPGMALGLIFALAVNQKIKGIAVFRAAYFLPVVVPTLAVAIVFRWLYNPDVGLINQLLGLVGIEGLDWLNTSFTALPAIAAMAVWQNLGWYMTFYLVGLQAIPRQLYEVAELDGAGRWMRFVHVTWPLLTPITFFVLVTSTIDNLQGAFDQVYVMTQGGPGYSSYTNSFYLYKQAFTYFHYGYAAAYGWVILTVIAIATFLQFKFLAKRINYDFG